MRRAATTVLLSLLVLPSLSAGQDPPLAPAQATAQTHTVSEGETLWSISRAYFGDSSHWREIFEANRSVVSDPNWLEPGQALTIPGVTSQPAPGPSSPQVTPEAVRASTAVPDETPTGARPTMFRPDGTPPPGAQRVPGRTVFYPLTPQDAVAFSAAADRRPPRVAVAHDVYHSAAWLVRQGDPVPAVGEISDFVNAAPGRTARSNALPFDRLRLRLTDGHGLEVGDRVQALRLKRLITGLGGVVEPTGVLTVVELSGAEATAVVSDEYARILIGDLITALPIYDLQPGVSPVASEETLEARILGFEDERELRAPGQAVFLDVGRVDGVSVGDEFEALAGDGVEWNTEVLGRVQVVRVQETMATARIVGMKAPVFTEGLSLWLSKKMP